MKENKPATGPVNYSGSVAKHYEKYQGPVFFEPYALEVANRIDTSTVRITLEIACGTGRVTRHLRKVLPPVSILIATDLSADMLQVAKEELKEQSIQWQAADAQDLPFDNNSIDLIVCCFGYMLVPDKQKAFQEAYRVLRHGGSLLFTTWDKLEYNGASHVHRQVVKKFLGGELPAHYTLAFSMNNDTEIKAGLTEAGFKDIFIERVEKTASGISASELAEGLACGGSVFNDLIKQNPHWIPEIQSEIEKLLIEKYGDAPMKSPMRALFTSARK